MNHEHFKTVTVRVKVAEMEGIAMTGTGAVQQFTVMVDTSRAINDFVTSVAIHVADSQRMRTFAVCTLTGGCGCMKPTLLQFLSIKIPCTKVAMGIISAAEHSTRLLAVKICHAGEIALAAVTIAIAPAALHRAERHIACSGNLFTGKTVEHSKILRTFEYDTIAVSIVVGHFVITHQHRLSFAVDCSGSGLAYKLGSSVAVKVIYHKLGIVGAGTDILTEIYAPQLCTVKLIAIDIYIGGKCLE